MFLQNNCPEFSVVCRTSPKAGIMSSHNRSACQITFAPATARFEWFMQRCIFHMKVKLELFFTWETWRSTKSSANRLQTFVKRCLRYMLQDKGQDRVAKEEVWRRAGHDCGLSDCKLDLSLQHGQGRSTAVCTMVRADPPQHVQ